MKNKQANTERRLQQQYLPQFLNSLARASNDLQYETEFIDAITDFLRVINGRIWALRTGDKRKILLKAERTAVLESAKTWNFVLFRE
jgi:hypothetical protein